MRCNHCWKTLEGDFYITKCSHAFCEADAQKFFSAELTCPACDKNLTPKYKNSKPNQPEKSNSLNQMLTNWYLSFFSFFQDLSHRFVSRNWYNLKTQLEKAMECCQNAVIFWDNQKEAEIRYNEFLNKELSTKLQSETGKNRESLLSAESQISVLSARLETASEEIDSHKQEIIELTEKCNQKSREKSKLQELYNSLKRKYETKSDSSASSLRYSKVILNFFKT
jgi:E3 ubiquitin-protein ligase CCNP1IP1